MVGEGEPFEELDKEGWWNWRLLGAGAFQRNSGCRSREGGRQKVRRSAWGSETLKFWWELRCNMGQEESPSQGERP